MTIDWLTGPWQVEAVRNGLIAVCVVGTAAGAAGYWLIQFGRAFEAESLAHGVMPGLGIMLVAGIPAGVGSIAAVAFAAAIFWLARSVPSTTNDAATAIAVTGLVGLGAIVISRDNPARLEPLLFGDPLGVSTGDLVSSSMIAFVCLLGLVTMQRPLTALLFDRAQFRHGSGQVRLIDLFLAVLTAVAVGLTVRVLGALLALALIAGPAAFAIAAGPSVGRAVAVSATAAAASGVLGIYLSYHLQIPAAAAVALVSTGLGLAAVMIRPQRATG